MHLRDSRFFDIIECHVPTIQANWMFPDGKVVYRLSTWVTFWIYFWLHYATTYMVHICDMWASVSRFSINYSWTATIHECIFLFRFFLHVYDYFHHSIFRYFIHCSTIRWLLNLGQNVSKHKQTIFFSSSDYKHV